MRPRRCWRRATPIRNGAGYYAMFYAASALLEAHGLRTRKHSGLHALFGEHFAKAGRIDPKFHRWLLEAFVMREAEILLSA